MVSGFTLITQQSSGTGLVQAAGVLLIHSLSGDLSTLSFEPHIPLCSSVVFLSQREGCCFSKILAFYFFVFGCAGSLLLHRLFSSWSEWGPLSSCCASHCSDFSYFRAQDVSLWAQKLWLPGSRAQGQ